MPEKDIELTVKEMLKNMIDELGRARDIIGALAREDEEEISNYSGEGGEADMLCSDIDSTWEQLDILDDLLK